MTGVDDLVTWLRAQWDADEREIAKHPDGKDEYLGGDLVATEEQNYPSAPYLAISKARALAELDAKRRIIRMYENAVAAHNAGSISQYNRGIDYGASDVLGDTVRLLALPMAGRDGYREEWRP